MKRHCILIALFFLTVVIRESSERKIDDLVSKYALNRNDYEWLVHSSCKTHGSSCPCEPAVTQNVGTLHAIMENDGTKISRLVDLYFGKLDEELKNMAISLTYTVVMNGDKAYSSIDYSPGGSIDATLIQVVGTIIPNGLIEIAVGVVTYKKKVCNDHVWLGEYYRSNEHRIKNALKYLFYEDARLKIEAASNLLIE